MSCEDFTTQFKHKAEINSAVLHRLFKNCRGGHG